MATAKRSREDTVSELDTDSDNGSSDEDFPTPPSTDTDMPTKRLQLDENGPASVSGSTAIVCTMPPHTELSFRDYEAYEVHYTQVHLHRCSECNKNFPSDHYLQLHIQENHDPFTAVVKDRGERTFGCFVEDCDRKCSTAQKRRCHVIDKHMFPKNYDFFIVNEGIDRRTSMLRQAHTRRPNSGRQQTHSKSGEVTGAPTGVSHGAEKEASTSKKPLSPDTISSLTRDMSALKFIPRGVKFGRGGSKSFTR